MTLKHVRICTHCGIVRWAPCSIACRVPDENNPRSWVEVLHNYSDSGTVVFTRQAS